MQDAFAYCAELVREGDRDRYLAMLFAPAERRDALAALIRDNKTFRINSDIQTGAKYGMQTLDGYLMEKYTAGLIARDEVVNKAQDPTTVIQKLAEWEAAQAELAAAQPEVTH